MQSAADTSDDLEWPERDVAALRAEIAALELAPQFGAIGPATGIRSPRAAFVVGAVSFAAGFVVAAAAVFLT
jgi:hypothetical protein